MSYGAGMPCPLLNSSFQTTFIGSVRAGATVRVNTTDYLSADIMSCMLSMQCITMPRATGTEGDFSEEEGVVVEGIIHRSSPPRSTLGRDNCQKGPTYQVNGKENLAKSPCLLFVSNISNFIKTFLTMNLRDCT